MANKVTVSLGLKNQLTSPLKGVMAGVRSEMENLGGVSQNITSSIGGMTTGFLGLAASIAASGLAMGGFVGGLKTASTFETNLIASAGDVASLVGTTYSKAFQSVKDIQKEVSKMAAALPGETTGYSGIANAVMSSISLGAKGSVKTMQTDVLAVTKTLGLLAASKAVDMTDAAAASNKFVSGSASIAEMFGSNDIFQKNPLFRTYLNEQLKTLGKTDKDWKSLDQEVRNKVIVAAGKRAFSVDTLKKFDGTADSLIQSIKTSLFDQQVGIFGFLRDIEGLGGQNTLSRVAVFLGAVNDLGTSLGKAGFNFDPMLEIGKSLNFLSDILYSVNLGITKGDWRGVRQMLTGMWKGLLDIPKMVADGFNDLISGLNSIDWSTVMDKVGEMATSIGAALKAVDWGGLGTGVAKAIGGILLNLETNKAIKNMLDEVMKAFIEALGAALLESVKGIPGLMVKTFDPRVDTARKLANEDPGEVEGFKNMLKLFGLSNGETKPLPQLQSSNGSTGTNQQLAFSPTITVTGSSADPQQMADYIMTALNGKFTEYRQSILT